MVSREYRQGSPIPTLTQLPPGAAIVTSGPRFAKPTLVPTWRMPVTLTTPRQFAGWSTSDPSLPAETTTTTPRAMISSIAAW